MWTPAEVTELVKVIFYGVTILCVPLATVFTVISAARSKRNAESIAAVGANVNRLEKNTNSISERNQAIAMKLGITEGIAQERASVQANLPDALPLPVSDEKTTEAVDKVVDAINELKK